MTSFELPSDSCVDILPATWRDLNALKRLEKTCFEKDAWPIWDLMGVLIFPSVVRLKAVVEGEMVGFIAGHERDSKKLAWIVTFAVLPAYRRQGIGSALLAECESRMGFPVFRLSVRRSNRGAQELYKKFGYRVVGVWPNYYVGKEDALVLEKKMNNSPYDD